MCLTKNLLISLSLSLGLFAACTSKDIQFSKFSDEEIVIFPDYKEVTIPVNIQPMNFSVSDNTHNYLIISGNIGGGKIQVFSNEGLFDIPTKQWKELLKANAGGQLELTVAKETPEGWVAYKPFHMKVANDSIDKYIAFRLLRFSNDMWNRMGIYQHNMETGKMTTIYENSLTDYNCVNCHTFPNQEPDQVVFHMRGLHPGTLLVKDGKLTKLNTKTEITPSNFVYMSWHPERRFLAATVCTTYQNFFANNPNILEVLDQNSDIVIYDSEKNELFTSEQLNSKEAWQIFPNFSPDGKSIYYSSSVKVEDVNTHYDSIQYSLCRVDFDAKTCSFGTQVDTLYNAITNKKSVSFPRVSPDGKYLAFTLQSYGGFGVWHKDADLYMVRLSDGYIYPLSAANTPDTGESYHSWSSNSHWLVFSNRREDKTYTRPYFTYIDDEGQAHKPFLLPQKNPKKYYLDLLDAYNVPEFVKEEVRLDKHAIMNTMREEKATQVRLKISK